MATSVVGGRSSVVGSAAGVGGRVAVGAAAGSSRHAVRKSKLVKSRARMRYIGGIIRVRHDLIRLSAYFLRTNRLITSGFVL